MKKQIIYIVKGNDGEKNWTEGAFTSGNEAILYEAKQAKENPLNTYTVITTTLYISE